MTRQGFTVQSASVRRKSSSGNYFSELEKSFGPLRWDRDKFANDDCQKLLAPSVTLQLNW
jgi:hypothetical protein